MLEAQEKIGKSHCKCDTQGNTLRYSNAGITYESPDYFVSIGFNEICFIKMEVIEDEILIILRTKTKETVQFSLFYQENAKELFREISKAHGTI